MSEALVRFIYDGYIPIVPDTTTSSQLWAPGSFKMPPVVTPSSSPVPMVTIAYDGDPRDRIGMILLLDVVPEHVEKTFWLVKKDDGNGYKSVSYDNKYLVMKDGDPIDTRISHYIIIYNGSDYHSTKVRELTDQLNSLIRGCVILALPVLG